jgi:hypothetical protein
LRAGARCVVSPCPGGGLAEGRSPRLGRLRAAQRTARYACSAAGDRQAADLGRYRQQWEKLEGREPQRQQEQAKVQKIERDNSPGMSL